MWITPGRVLYSGLLGRLSQRKIGSIIVYIAQQSPLRVSIDGGDWEQGDLLVVPAYLPHRIVCDEKTITDILIEPETVQHAGLPDFLRDRRGAVQAPAFVAHVQAVLAQLRTQAYAHTAAFPPHDAEFDQRLFGAVLAAGQMDPRIQHVLADVEADPGGSTSAAEYAARAGLSTSPFVHLFREQVGVPIRTLRMWKRARSLLRYVSQSVNMAEIAQLAGYPDSSHFSHSIRAVFGMSPKDMFEGSRGIDLHSKPARTTPVKTPRR